MNPETGHVSTPLFQVFGASKKNALDAPVNFKPKLAPKKLRSKNSKKS